MKTICSASRRKLARATDTMPTTLSTVTNMQVNSTLDFTATSGILYFAPGVVSNSFAADILLLGRITLV